MKRALILLSGVGAGLYPILSCALGLGDLQVDSRLNQPLRAHIEISDVTEEEWHQIHARLAPQDEGGGLLRTVLDSIVFRTREDANHRYVVELSSNDPITEPLFDLSVEVAGQTVQVIRNYSVFLDPPGRDEVGSRGVMVAGNGTQAVEPSAAARATTQGVGSHGAGAAGATARGTGRASAGRLTAGGGGTAGASSATGVVDTATRAAAGVSAGGAATRGGKTGGAAASSGVSGAGTNQQIGLQAGAVYTVAQSDTLERIVRRLGARTAAAKNQQMQWVFEHNPAAFYGSMDRLRAGARLTLPGQSPAAIASAGGGAPEATAGDAGGYADARRPGRSAAVRATPGGGDSVGEAAAGAANKADLRNTPAPPRRVEAQSTPVAAGGQKATAPDDRVLQAQLEGQVDTLQQSLAKMEQTIAAQDAEIADLNRKIAARAEQQRAERVTNALAARSAPEVASESDDTAQSSGAATSKSDTVEAASAAAGVAESGSSAARAGAAAATSGDDTSVPKRVPRWWAKRATYYWGGLLGAAAILVAVLVTVIRKRREAAIQYAPRYPLVEESPFRYRATLEPPPPVKQVPRQPEPGGPMGQPEVRQPSGGVQVEESDESGLESWSTQTALLLSELPAADDTQPFMMAPHDEDETEYENKRRSFGSNTEEPTAKLQAMETHTVELQTTGELMSPEELAEAELLGLEDPSWSAHGRQGDSRAGSSGSGQVRSEQGHVARGGFRALGQVRSEQEHIAQGGRGALSQDVRAEKDALEASDPDRTMVASAPGARTEEMRTVEIGAEQLLALEALNAPTPPGAASTAEMDLALEHLRAAQMSTTEIEAAELHRDRTAANKEVAEILEASLSYEPDRVDIKLKLLEIYHHEALGNRDNFRSLLGKLAKDSRLLSPAQRQHVETLQRTLNEGKQDTDSSFVAEVAI